MRVDVDVPTAIEKSATSENDGGELASDSLSSFLPVRTDPVYEFTPGSHHPSSVALILILWSGKASWAKWVCASSLRAERVNSSDDEDEITKGDCADDPRPVMTAATSEVDERSDRMGTSMASRVWEKGDGCRRMDDDVRMGRPQSVRPRPTASSDRIVAGGRRARHQDLVRGSISETSITYRSRKRSLVDGGS